MAVAYSVPVTAATLSHANHLPETIQYPYESSVSEAEYILSLMQALLATYVLVYAMLAVPRSNYPISRISEVELSNSIPLLKILQCGIIKFTQ